jgi:hypothetical protein
MRAASIYPGPWIGPVGKRCAQESTPMKSAFFIFFSRGKKKEAWHQTTKRKIDDMYNVTYTYIDRGAVQTEK